MLFSKAPVGLFKSSSLVSIAELYSTDRCIVAVVAVELVSCVQLFATPRAVALQVPFSMGFPRQEYWSGLPFPSPGDLPDPGIKSTSPTLAGRLLITESTGKANRCVCWVFRFYLQHLSYKNPGIMCFTEAYADLDLGRNSQHVVFRNPWLSLN